MTRNELISEFNLYYNNLASNQAPGLDEVEISIYMTKAQNMLQDSLYNEYEKSEEARRKLTAVVKTAKLKPINISTNNLIYPKAKCYSSSLDIDNNTIKVKYIVNEQIKIKDTSTSCSKGLRINIQPIIHDEIDNIVQNPYRYNIRRALRLDADNHIEIIYKKPEDIEYYQIRYIKVLNPIILYTSSEYTDTIEGFSPLPNDYMLPELPEFTHRQIVEIAAKLAYQDYKQ